MSLARSKGLSPDKLADDPASFKLEKVGSAFNPMAESQRENGIQQRVLPENVYTAAIVAWLNNETSLEAAVGAAFFTAPPVALTIFLQVTLISYLQVSVKDYDGDLEAVCLTDHKMLLYTGLSTFVGLSLGNLYTILEAHKWLRMFGSCERHEELMLQKYLLKPTQQAPTSTCKEESGKEESSVYPDCVDEAMDGVARSMEDGLDEAMGTDEVRGVCRPQSGITPCARAGFYAFLLLPWAAVTVGVLFAGSGSVLRSGNRFDLVLNCVAAIFVLELGEVTYALLLPRTIKNSTAGLPPLNRVGSEGGAVASALRKYGTLFFFWIVIAATAVVDVPLHYFWCNWSVD